MNGHSEDYVRKQKLAREMFKDGSTVHEIARYLDLSPKYVRGLVGYGKGVKVNEICPISETLNEARTRARHGIKYVCPFTKLCENELKSRCRECWV